MIDNFEIIRSRRRTVSVEVKSDLRVIVRAPLRMKEKDIRQFVDGKEAWIEKHVALVKERQSKQMPSLFEDEIHELVSAAKEDIPLRVARFAEVTGVTVNRITVRAQKTRWGSCSSKGNLSFNCLLMLCPEEIRDYVVVHELCHLMEMNHSPQFWKRVESVLPDYRESRKWLKNSGSLIIGRLR